MKKLITSILQGKEKSLLSFIWISIFFPISIIYSIASLIIRASKYLKRKKYEKFHSKITISIGNITLGGTGKTPLTLSLAEHFLNKGKKVAVILRGYNGKLGKIPVILNKNNLEEAGDESIVYFESLKNKNFFVIVANNREEGWIIGQKMADILLLDDGFQRCSVPRNLEILTFNYNYPLGNGFIFPAGYLREPFFLTNLADIIFFKLPYYSESQIHIRRPFKKFREEKSFYFFYLKPEILENIEGERVHWEKVKDKKISAFSGIGDNELFKKFLEFYFKKKISFVDFEDHHDYTEADLKFIFKTLPKSDLYITTLKDFVKIKKIFLKDRLKYNKKNVYFLKVKTIIIDNKGKEKKWSEILTSQNFKN